MATIAVDCWVEKAAAIEARVAWPSKEVLAFALALAVAGKGSAAEERMRNLLLRAAQAVLRKKGGKELELVERTLLCMDGVQTSLLDTIPRAEKAGATKVSGRATVVDFAASAPFHADGAGGCGGK